MILAFRCSVIGILITVCLNLSSSLVGFSLIICYHIDLIHFSCFVIGFPIIIIMHFDCSEIKLLQIKSFVDIVS